jgi:histidinol-phosphatase (PHP family)
MLPADSHVHSEWSWDAPSGDMERTCARAVEIGLPAVAFTEHLDHTVWRIDKDGPYASEHLTAIADAEGILTPPAFDVVGYLEAIERCRERFPELRILSGLEMGEPHQHAQACARILAAGRFDRVLGSLHTLPDQDGYAEPWGLYPHRDPYEIMREYLAAVATGDAVTFGSDAHLAAYVGHAFTDAARMAEAHGFRPGRDPHDLWGRAG